jgi:hypothetical protein
MMLEECNRWRRDGEVKQARKKRILAQWAPHICSKLTWCFWNKIASELGYQDVIC